MKFPFLLAVVLGLASISARAEVLIYSGTVRLTELEVRKKPFVRKAFLIADPVAKSTQLVTYGKAGRIKSRAGEAANVGDYFSGAFQTGGPLLEIYAYLRKEDDLGVVRHSLFLRGFPTTLQVGLNQGKPVTAVYSKFLKGSSRKLVASLGAIYIEQEISLVFDKARTIDANVRGLSAATAYDDITALLEARGYTEF